MFFRKAGKYLTILYIFYFAFFLILYFLLFKDYGFASEVYSLKSVFSGMDKIQTFLMPALILFYFVDAVVVVKYLTDFHGKRISFSFYVYYVLSSVFGLLFYFIFFLVAYFPFSKLIAKLKEVSLTEVPVVLAYSGLFLVVLLLWKLVTYWKIRSRLNYFGKYPGLKFLIMPLNGFKFKGFLKFLFFVGCVVGIPFAFFVFGVLDRNGFLVSLAVIFAYVFFPFAKLYVYYLLTEKREI